MAEHERAKVVRQIFEWVGKDGCSIAQVCNRLQKNEILTRTGKRWRDRTTVWEMMLKNSAYKGILAESFYRIPSFGTSGNQKRYR